MCNDMGTPDRIHGQKADLDVVDKGSIRITAQDKFEEEFKDAHEGQTEIILKGKSNGEDHGQNFL